MTGSVKKKKVVMWGVAEYEILTHHETQKAE
jgi:hypothetical protein